MSRGRFWLRCAPCFDVLLEHPSLSLEKLRLGTQLGWIGWDLCCSTRCAFLLDAKRDKMLSAAFEARLQVVAP